MHSGRLFSNLEKANSLDIARSAGEIFFDEGLLETDSFEDLGAAIRLIGRDAHLGHHFVESFANGLDVALLRILRIDFRNLPVQFGKRLQREIRVDRLGAIPGEQSKVMNLSRRSRLDDEAHRSAQTFFHEMLVHRRGRQQRRYRQHRLRNAAIRKDQDVEALMNRVFCVRGEARERGLHAVRTPG